MKKATISQPMKDVPENKIIATRERAINYLETNGYEIVNNYFSDEWSNPENMKERGVVNIPVAFLSKSIEKMSMCDAVYFCKGWETARGCKAEHKIAEEYGLKIIYE